MRFKRLIGIILFFSLMYACPQCFGNDTHKKLELQVARDLIGPAGIFYTSKSFLSTFTRAHSVWDTDFDKADYLISSILQNKQSERRMRTFQKKLHTDADYREFVKLQIQLAFKHDNSLTNDFNYVRETLENHKTNIRFQRGQSKDLAFLFGTLSNIGIMVGNTTLGGPAIFTTALWPIMGLGPMMSAWKFGLAIPLARHSRRPLAWARSNLRNHIADLGEKICEDLGISKFPRPKESLSRRIINKIPHPTKSWSEYLPKLKRETKKQIPTIEVIRLSTHSDGSPLLVTKENLMGAINFRNSLPLYKGQDKKLTTKDGLLFYPSTEIKTVSGLQTVLKDARLTNQILIPETYRAASSEDPIQKLETLLRALTQYIESTSMGLPRTPSNSTNQNTCKALSEIGRGG